MNITADPVAGRPKFLTGYYPDIRFLDCHKIQQWSHKFNLKKKLTFSYSFCTVKFSTCNRCSSQVTKDFLIIIQKYFALFCKCRLKLRISFFAKVWAGQKWTGSATLGEHVVKSKDVEANRRQKHCTVWLVLNVQQPAKQKNCFSKWRRPIVHIVIL